MKRYLQICSFLISLLLLTACSGAGGSGAALWIAVPVNGLELTLGDELHIEGHAVNSGDIASVEIWANELLLETVTDLLPMGELIGFESFWTPSEAGEVVLTAIAHTAGEETLGEDSVRVLILDSEPETPTTVPAEGVTPEVITPEVACEPNLTATMNANCRFGPNSVFDVLGYLLEGETVAIDGRLADNSWWLIPNPDRAGQCWIASNVAEAACLTDGIPVVASPPTPVPVDSTAPPVPTPVYPVGGQSIACMAQVALAWNPLSDESGIAATQVQVERSSDNASWSGVSGSPWTIGDANKHFISIECGWYYRWRVRVQDGAGNWSDYSAWAVFQVPLS